MKKVLLVLWYPLAIIMAQVSRIGVVLKSSNKEFTKGEYSEPGKYRRFYLIEGFKIKRLRMTENNYNEALKNAEKNKVDFPV